MMRTTTIRFFLLGVTLAACLQAELLPNPAGESGEASSSASWFGQSVQDSGFLLTNNGNQASGGRASQDQGFSSYYAARDSEDSGSSNQLTPYGAFNSQTQSFSSGSTSMGTLVALGGVSDILAETVSVTSSFASRPVSAMTPFASSVPQPRFANDWQINSQASSEPYGTFYGAQTNYSTQSSYNSYGQASSYSYNPATGFSYNPATGFSYLNQFANNYGQQASNENEQSNNGPSYDFYSGLMNASVASTQSYAPATYFVLPGLTISAQQAFAPTPFQPPPVITNFDTAVPEPGTWALLVSAVAAIVVRRRYQA
jgi:hypothetical protein